ncbi:MAG: 2-C-methyl-D-erythritol 4-phosphate cytidylyltransferase [Verrucomicrobia bacterium]|nr:2-C-methyl-D-erythritol 4-phosphate cytidylyltransferase [Verrucomicrobiota bacterium]
MTTKPCDAVIVAAGSGRRMGFDKMTALLAGEPVLRHTVRAFEECDDIRAIHIVTASAAREEVADFLRGARKVTAIVEGGAERHLSVWNGLRSLSPDAAFVAVHDGARALATPALISRCLAAAQAHGAASAAAPVTDTLKRAEPAGRIVDSVDRTALWAMQTPQVFAVPLLRRAYEAVLSRGEIVTDETSAVAALGEPVQIVPNDDWNVKITFPRDLPLAEWVLAARRTGR